MVWTWDMASQPRNEQAGAVYHGLNRGDQREPIYRQGNDQHRFRAPLCKPLDKTQYHFPARQNV